MSQELNVVNNKIFKSCKNCRELKKSQKLTLYDLDLKEVLSETPDSYSL